MTRIMWTTRCAVIGTFIFVWAMSAHSQDDPFGGLNDTPAAEQSIFADPAAAPQATSAVKSLLAAEPGAEAEPDHKDFCRCVGETESPIVERIEIALRSPLHSNGLDFAETPLEEVVNLLQDEYGIPIQLDTNAMEDIGLDATEPVTINLHKISLRSALRLMLKQLQLTYVIRNEVLMITTPEAAESQLLTCVYDIRGFVDVRSDKTIKQIIDTITSCVATETWKENGGGEAELRELKPGLLVISQTQAVHEEIGGLLAAIRELRQDQPDASDAAAAAAGPDVEKVVTQSYLLQINQSGDSEKLRDQVRELIVQSVPDERWAGRLDDGQPVVLSILSDRIVLRHKPTVQNEVQALLVESGVAAPIPPGNAETAGRGFGAGAGGGGGGFFQPDPAIGN